jgi:NAD(P)-dependent dehydrogenase (short-subunit alcohol dehydrogenase family)
MPDLHKLKRIVTSTVQAFKSKRLVPIVSEKDKDLLKDKVALITGGSGGIGFAIAQELNKSGCNVILAGTNEKKLNVFSQKLNGAKHVIINLSSIDSIRQGVADAIACYGRIDILVNSAGVHSKKVFNNFLDVEEEDYDHILDINLKGTYFVTQAVAKDMVNKKIHGHILNISSSTGNEPGWSPYRLSKWGVKAMTLGFAQQLQPYGIIVNGIAPGSTATPLHGFKDGDSLYTQDNGNHRLTMPSEIAQFAKMMVSDMGNMIVGDMLYISGGRGTVDIR